MNSLQGNIIGARISNRVVVNHGGQMDCENAPTCREDALLRATVRKKLGLELLTKTGSDQIVVTRSSGVI